MSLYGVCKRQMKANTTRPRGFSFAFGKKPNTPLLISRDFRGIKHFLRGALYVLRISFIVPVGVP